MTLALLLYALLSLLAALVIYAALVQAGRTSRRRKQSGRATVRQTQRPGRRAVSDGNGGTLIVEEKDKDE